MAAGGRILSRSVFIPPTHKRSKSHQSQLLVQESRGAVLLRCIRQDDS